MTPPYLAGLKCCHQQCFFFVKWYPQILRVDPQNFLKHQRLKLTLARCVTFYLGNVYFFHSWVKIKYQTFSMSEQHQLYRPNFSRRIEWHYF